MDKRFQFITIGIILFFSTLVLIIANTTLESKTQELKNDIFLNTTKEIHNEIDILVKNKRQSTLSLALALSRDRFMISALKNQDDTKLRLDELSLKLREFTRFKNVWFQIIDQNGYSFYRSWIEKRGDKIANARIDIQQMLKTPRVMSSISVGKFDMTFKSMVPIYDDNNMFLGIFEIITHFNSISRKLREKGFEAIILADKKYKKQLKHPFTNMFIEDYYVSNLDANQNLQNIINTKTVESFLTNSEKYIIDDEDNIYSTVHRLSSSGDKELGYFIVFKYLDTFAMKDVKNTQQNIIIGMIFIILFITIIGYYIFNKKYHSLLKKNLAFTKEEKNKIKAILSAQPYIIMLVSENQSFDVNDEFFEFFPQFRDLDAFKNEISCICNLFIKPDNDDGTYVYDKDDDWIDYLVNNKDKEHKVAMFKNKQLHHFIVRASRPKLYNTSDSFAILTFIDITEQKKKDELLFDQSKHASMGEMIANIAHQWRQPLSIISTAATGMLMQKQLGFLDDEKFEMACNQINENSQYLSKTINDFRDFLKGESKIEPFNIKDAIESFLHLTEPVAKDNNIHIVTTLKDDFIIHGSQNELLQCFINIFNNSKDAFISHDEIEPKNFFINVSKADNTIELIFKDNAGGIDPAILTKIFDPYFTTKHQSQGTGLGLSMTYKLITSQMDGRVTAENETYIYEGKECKGAKFIIAFKI